MFSFEEKRRIGETLAAASDERFCLAHVYFEELFAEEPEIREIFSGDLADHVQRFNGLLQSIPLAFELPDEMRSILRATGDEHYRLGLREAHYDAMFRAVMHALAKVAGRAWDDAAAEAWARFLAFCLCEMQAGWTEAAEARQAVGA